jgi:hypothetical protein
LFAFLTMKQGTGKTASLKLFLNTT